MRQMNFALALLTAAALAACGGTGSSGGDQTHKVAFTKQVSFGDSLSDVGTYNVGTVKTLGGGKFTINGNNTSTNSVLTGLNWTEVLAAELKLPAPCAAQTGLEGTNDPSKGLVFNVPVTFQATCYNYAQGGSRVENPVGPGNLLAGSAIGETTVPVTVQVANHLAKSGGKFSGTELVTIMAGGNDVLMLLGKLSADATTTGSGAFAGSLIKQLAAGANDPAAAATAIGIAVGTESAKHSSIEVIVGAAVTTAAQQPGNSAVADKAVYGPMVATAQAAGAAAGLKFASDHGAELVASMDAAGKTLGDLVKNEIVAKGANYVVVNNLPDVASTPSGRAQSKETQALISAMVDAFNSRLKTTLGTDARIAYVDLFSVSRDQVANPAIYGLTNTSTPACGPNPLGTTSLVCTSANTVAGDVSHYMFADDIHPTPYEYWLVTRYVLKDMAVKGWL
jgi:outer membrane lipase/esterase